jgi:hypothetical protein
MQGGMPLRFWTVRTETPNRRSLQNTPSPTLVNKGNKKGRLGAIAGPT